MKVSFILVHSKRQVSPVRASVRYSGDIYNYKTGESVDVSKWDKKNQRCTKKGYKEAAAINMNLEYIESAIKNTILYYKRDFKVPTKDEFKRKVGQFLSGQNALQIKEDDQNFVDYVERFIGRSDKSDLTKRGYTTVLNKLKQYQEEKGLRLSFADINQKFYSEFKSWVYEKGYIRKENGVKVRKEYSRNYWGTLVKDIKVFMGEAKKVDKLHSYEEFDDFKVETETADSVYLTTEELIKIHKLVIDANLIKANYDDTRPHNVERKVKALNLARNKFLIGAFTALRVSNFNRIQDHNIKNGVITVLPLKGSGIRKPEPVKIPMHWVIKDILEKGFDLQQEISEQKLNKHIKQVCKLAGIKDQVVSYRTEGGEIKEHINEKWEVITTHTARRSGATNMYKAGIPRKAIMLLTGHKTEKQFEKYIKLTAEENAEILMNHAFFNK